jgi:hypothetical protein
MHAGYDGVAMWRGRLLPLVFWARNMVTTRDAGMSWPGFSYKDAEWARLDGLSGGMSDDAFRAFRLWTAVIFIAIAAIGIAGIFLPLATILFPVPAETKALHFLLLLAAVAILIIGIGPPIAMELAAILAADRRVRQQLEEQPGDQEIARKVNWQIWRITLVMCGLLVPGALLFIAYNIEGGPIITALKWAMQGVFVASIGIAELRRRAARRRGS